MKAMKNIYLFLAWALALTTTSCNDWLDVTADTVSDVDEQFGSYNKFQQALIGCYMTMAGEDAYGTRLTMSNIESLAGIWLLDENPTSTGSDRYVDYYLQHREYDDEYVKTAIESIYSTLFNAIVQANMIIENADVYADVFDTEAQRSIVKGEAYAIRAFCQLDVLRLFGQVPDGTTAVELPYSETTSYDEIPPYYTFDEYVAKLESDLDMAESLLYENDPVFTYTFSQLNYSGNQLLDDDYLYYRQSRLNYWAVKALKARTYLYAGETDKAYEAAMEVINATDSNGDAVMTMSGNSDLMTNNYKALPNECLFYLSQYDVLDMATILIGGASTQCNQSGYLYMTLEMLNDMYSGEVTASHNRYLYQWNRTARNSSNTLCATLMKYYYDDDEVEDKMLYYQILPMLRMSEMYLIAIETTTSLSEANELYTDYMLEHNVVISSSNQFTSLVEIPDWIVDEYLREFVGEGQAFYNYKRTNQASLWQTGGISEDDYVIPLPDTEYNPNDL